MLIRRVVSPRRLLQTSVDLPGVPQALGTRERHWPTRQAFFFVYECSVRSAGSSSSTFTSFHQDPLRHPISRAVLPRPGECMADEDAYALRPSSRPLNALRRSCDSITRCRRLRGFPAAISARFASVRWLATKPRIPGPGPGPGPDGIIGSRQRTSAPQARHVIILMRYGMSYLLELGVRSGDTSAVQVILQSTICNVKASASNDPIPHTSIFIQLSQELS